MKNNDDIFVVSKLSIAVQSALLVMLTMPLSTYAEEGDTAVLTHPANSMEIGATYVSAKSAKFGEYNGMDKKGGDLIGNFSLRGGNAYNSFDGGDGTRRWDINGRDLGTTSRELGASVGDQGKWNLGIGYDELRHNYTNTYQTPFLGAMGGNVFTLPANFGIIGTKAATVVAAPGLTPTTPGSNQLTPAQLADLNGNMPNVYSQRENAKFNVGYIYDSNWDVKFDYNHLKQSGAKLQGVAGDQANGNTSASTSGFAGQTPFVIMNPTNYTTDTLNLALNWVGDKAYATASYYGSFFRDANNTVSFSNPFNNANTITGTGTLLALPVDSMSTMPSNDFNQLNLNGGYNISSATKLVGGLSYARNTQNNSYAQQGLTPNGFPQASLNGLVVTTHADFKLTNLTTKDLQLSAALKYNERDNQTASNTYQFVTIAQYPVTTSATGLQSSVNTPMSNKKTQLDLDADYRIDQKQKLNLSYGYEEIKRWCSGVVYPLVSPVAATGLTSYTATSCAEVPQSKENKIAATYKLKANDNLNFSAGAGYADRIASINPLFYNPMQTTGTAGSVGAGYEIPGFVAYMNASRKQQFIKAGVNWQANDKLTFSANTRYTDDKYPSTFGVQNGNSYSLNLDTTYAYAENSSLSAYASMQNSKRDMTNAQQWSGATNTANTALTATTTAPSNTKLNIPAGTQTWTNTLKENDITVGLGAKQGGLMNGRLDFSGDLTYSLGKTAYGTALNYASVDVYGNTCSSVFYQTCGDLPNITSELIKLTMVGTYTLDKISKVRLGYVFQHLNAADFMYNGYQYGSTGAALMPTNQQAPQYSTNIVFVSYIHDL